MVDAIETEDLVEIPPPIDPEPRDSLVHEEPSSRVPDHLAAPYLAQRADEHFQASIQNVMKASEKNNLLLNELLPLITKLQREKSKFDKSGEETCDLSEFQADIDRIKEIYRVLKQQGHSLESLAGSSADDAISRGDAEAFLNKMFPDDLDLENMDQWEFEELKEQLSHWRDTVKRDIDFNTNSLFAVLQLYISCHNVLQNMMRGIIEGRKKMTDNQIAR